MNGASSTGKGMKRAIPRSPYTRGPAGNLETSLPREVSEGVRTGRVLAGDDFTDQQLSTWFSQEREAFFQQDDGNSDVDPWYAYMRFVNETLGFSRVSSVAADANSVLVIGPGSGIEIKTFAERHPDWHLHLLEASSNFRVALKDRWPWAVVLEPATSGDIGLKSDSQSLVCAFSVLHHIPNVSKVVKEVGRILRPGGVFLVREPCSSMGDWRFPRSATPNERGIGRDLLVAFAKRAGLEVDTKPVPILFEPLNKALRCSIGYSAISFSLLYRVDRVVSWFAAFNDYYWRDSWYKKFGPSSYFYVFRKSQFC